MLLAGAKSTWDKFPRRHLASKAARIANLTASQINLPSAVHLLRRRNISKIAYRSSSPFHLQVYLEKLIASISVNEREFYAVFGSQNAPFVRRFDNLEMKNA